MLKMGVKVRCWRLNSCRCSHPLRKSCQLNTNVCKHNNTRCNSVTASWFHQKLCAVCIYYILNLHLKKMSAHVLEPL